MPEPGGFGGSDSDNDRDNDFGGGGQDFSASAVGQDDSGGGLGDISFGYTDSSGQTHTMSASEAAEQERERDDAEADRAFAEVDRQFDDAFDDSVSGNLSNVQTDRFGKSHYGTIGHDAQYLGDMFDAFLQANPTMTEEDAYGMLSAVESADKGLINHNSGHFGYRDLVYWDEQAQEFGVKNEFTGIGNFLTDTIGDALSIGGIVTGNVPLALGAEAYNSGIRGDGIINEAMSFFRNFELGGEYSGPGFSDDNGSGGDNERISRAISRVSGASSGAPTSGPQEAPSGEGEGIPHEGFGDDINGYGEATYQKLVKNRLTGEMEYANIERPFVDPYSRFERRSGWGNLVRV